MANVAENLELPRSRGEFGGAFAAISQVLCLHPLPPYVNSGYFTILSFCEGTLIFQSWVM